MDGVIKKMGILETKCSMEEEAELSTFLESGWMHEHKYDSPLSFSLHALVMDGENDFAFALVSRLGDAACTITF